MAIHEQVHSAVRSVIPVVESVPDDALGRPTPCTEFDVRTLANHLLGTSEAMRRIGVDEALDPDDPWGTGGDHLTATWREDLAGRLRAYADAWDRPDAFEGDALGGTMPRRMVGGMAYVEVLLHGWDLARGSGQRLEPDDAVVAAALEVMEQIGAMGREQGAFGAQVELPDGASGWHRVLAQAGRDPEWSVG